MGRHRSDLLVQLTARVPRGNQAFWDLMRQLRRFTITDLDLRSNIDRGTVGDFVRRLARGGYIEHVETTEAGAKVYELRRDQPEAPRLKRDGSPAVDVGRGQEQMWRAMKMLGTFSVDDIAVHATTDDCRVTFETAKSYLKHLHRAGYLAVVRPGRAGRMARRAVYRLIPSMNTGPLAPQIQRTDWVWDPNRKQVMGPEGKGGAK